MATETWSNISAEDCAAIDAAAHKLFYVEKDEQGNKSIELYADYNDTNEFLLETAYDHRNDAVKSSTDPDYDPENSLMDAIYTRISDSYDDAVWSAEEAILREAGFNPYDDEPQKDYLRSEYCICPPYDHYLDQTMRVNIMLHTPEDKDQEHGLIHDQILAMARPDELTDSSPAAIQALLQADSSLKRLVEQQGHTMQELHDTMKAYIRDFYDPDGHPSQYLDDRGKSLPYETRMDIFTAGRSKFLTSVCEELDNQSYECGCITVLAEVSMREYVEMMKPGKEITMPSDSRVGIFTPWEGAGSLMGIYLAESVVFRWEDIFDIQIEGAKPDFGYSLDNVFGLGHGCWHKPVSIQDKAPERKPSLAVIIQSAANRAAATSGQTQENQREGR